ncbi:hypothetical protein GCM10023084_39880 [Streptomyces lacrimifluminis]|uniref:SH3b domain-containing protein n=1 Tax=Streptomyces lacrimifluminis TaxID=1500077 RepID=A0A917NZV5_9ACTN|nr:hypothetical protein [Streptomyces lacrimifluminis]GGJ40476.1 hypothetical protein GCM10012282_41500 [Streptomyces lacrimifluminis]
MAKTSTRLAAMGLALGAALTLLGTTGSAHAAAQASGTTLQPNSNVRAEPNTSSRVLGTTTSQALMYIVCFKHAQYVKVGNYGTDVWYYGDVDDRGTNPMTWYHNPWVWGGNVNVGADPAPGIRECS